VGGRTEFEGALPGHGHQQVVGFGDRDQKALQCHRFHRLAVGGDDRHGAAGVFQVKIGGRGAVDDPQPDRLARFGRNDGLDLAVGQEIIIGHVRDIHRRHALQVLEKIRPEGSGAGRAEQALPRALFQGEPFAAPLQGAQDLVGIVGGPVREQHHMIPIRMALEFVLGDDDCPVQTALFLQFGMGMVPVGAGLADGKLVGEGGAGLDGNLGDEGHAVHVRRQQDAVPVNGGGDIHLVGHVDACQVPSVEVQGRPRNPVVDGHAFGPFALDDDRLPGEGQVIFPDRGQPGGWPSDKEYQHRQYGFSDHGGPFLMLFIRKQSSASHDLRNYIQAQKRYLKPR